MSNIILGPGLIGEAASKKAQAAAVDESGGGAIQLGVGIANDKFQKRKLAQAALVPVALAGNPNFPDAGPPNSLAVAPPVLAVIPELDLAAAESGPGLSEEDIEVMLADDANAWDLVIEAEGKRAEGWRPRVAGMLLLAAPEATAKPMPEEIVTELQRIADIAIQADAEKLTAAVGAAPEIGTGDPDAATDEQKAPKTTRRAAR